jgi:hypothetical protein
MASVPIFVFAGNVHVEWPLLFNGEAPYWMPRSSMSRSAPRSAARMSDDAGVSHDVSFVRIVRLSVSARALLSRNQAEG